jgi:hypothetical protein
MATTRIDAAITIDEVEDRLRIAMLQFARTGGDADAEIVVTLQRAREHMRIAAARDFAVRALAEADGETATPVARLAGRR